MNPSLAAAVVAVVLTATWLLGRRRVPLVRDVDTSAVAALNRAQIARVQAGVAATAPATPPGLTTPPARSAPRAAAPPVASAAGRAAYRSQLEAWFRGDGPSRLRAIEAAHRWGDRLTLPLLRRGLRDPDPAVMRAAAAAIERFRGRPAAAPLPQRAPLPRKVSRTR
jgi:HEAT repeat protein